MQISNLQISGGLQLWPSDPIFGDPYFQYTTLLLPGNGTNNQNNNVFLDSSTNNFTITRTGNTTQGTFSPFSQTGWSNYFDGSGDYLSAASGAAGNLFSGSFTIELWFFPITSASTQSLIQQDEASWRINTTGTQLQWVSSGGVRFTSSTNFILNQWNHMAVVSNGSSIVMYINGVSSGSDSLFRPSNSNGNVVIGINTASVGPVWPFLGYISNVRLVKGTALYTANFTPPTSPLTAIANTSLLTCQSNRFIDNSTNNFSITRNGDVSVQSFSPFNPTSVWSAASVGGSGYFDGTGDYLSVSNNALFNFGTGDFTIECYIYIAGNSAADSGNSRTAVIASTQQGPTITSDGFSFRVNGNSTTTGTGLVIEIRNGGNNVGYAGAATIPQGSWNHIAICRNGTLSTFYLNGINIGTATFSNQNISSTAALTVGGQNITNFNRFLNGYINDLRITKGTAVYTANFTPPTAPLTNIANTSLLTNFTNAGITDATSKNILETIGDAKISTAQSKFGGSSMFFDGTGDYLSIRNNALFNFGTGDFTIECYIYIAGNSAPDGANFRSAVIASTQQGPTTPSDGFTFQLGGTSTTTGTNITIEIRNGGNNVAYFANATIPQNSWNHIAICRNGTLSTFYLNGINIGTATFSNQNISSTAGLSIGGQNITNFNRFLNGYINDLRITKGYARYTTNFTPPTTAFPIL